MTVQGKEYINPARLVPLVSKPGVKRDGTKYDSMGLHTDSLWCRWQHGRARKMWGYNMISNNFSYPSRGCFGYSENGVYYLASGSPSNLQVQQFNMSAVGGEFTDITPSALTPSSNNMWQFDIMYDAGTSNASIIAHAAPNLSAIDSNVQQPIFYGNAYTPVPLTEIASSAVAGGVVVLNPYLFGLDADGGVIWSVANTPSDFIGTGSGSARITGQKIVCGKPARGGPGADPAGILWALDAIINVNFVGGEAVFDFDRIVSKGYSILSSQCVVPYDSLYYWPGQDRFFVYNGVVQSLPCNTHINFFFDNLNFDYRQKVRGTYNPHWGEVQWLAPLFGATECNWMLVYNVNEGTWYDTPINAIMGEHNEVFPYPVMFDNTELANGMTQLWAHDYGRDSVNGSQILAIQSYYQSEMFSTMTPTIQPITGGEDVDLKVKRFIPDFRDQSGDLIVTLSGQKYPQSTPDEIQTLTCPVGTEKLDPRFQSKMFTVKIESNTLGGDYQCGMPQIAVQKGTVRP